MLSQLMSQTSPSNMVSLAQVSQDRHDRSEASNLRAVSRRYGVIKFQYEMASYESLRENNNISGIAKLIREYTTRRKAR